jgi:hypothetical protein
MRRVLLSELSLQSRGAYPSVLDVFDQRKGLLLPALWRGRRNWYTVGPTNTRGGAQQKCTGQTEDLDSDEDKISANCDGTCTGCLDIDTKGYRSAEDLPAVSHGHPDSDEFPALRRSRVRKHCSRLSHTVWSVDRGNAARAAVTMLDLL